MDLRGSPIDIAPAEDGFRTGGPLTLTGLPVLGPVPLGRVHDDNAAYLGGAAGHAGLFASAAGLWRIVGVFMESFFHGSPYVSKETAREFIKERRAKDQSRRALGFDVFDKPGGGLLFGHLGYTGTSVHFDPEGGGALVFLTNRVHPTSRNSRMDSVRKGLLELCFGEGLEG